MVQAHPSPALARGRTLEDGGDYEGALLAYDEGLQADPLDPGLWSARAWVLVRLRRTEEALASSLRAVGLDPRRAFLYKDHGQILFRLGRREEALEFFRRAVEIDPVRPGLRLHLAQALLQVGRRGEAGQEALRAVEVARRRPDPHLYGKLASAGRILQIAGYPADALRLYGEAMGLNPHRRGMDNLVEAARRDLDAQGPA